MDKSDISKNATTDRDDLSLPLPELVVLGPAETEAVAGGFLVVGGFGGIGRGGCPTCGIMQPFPLGRVGL